VEEIPVAVAQAFATMTSGRPRPAYLEIPYDLLAERASVTLVGPLQPVRSLPDQSQLELAARRLAAADSAVIIAGGGAIGASCALNAVADRLVSPVVTTFNGKGVIPSEHPLSLGCGLHLQPVRELVKEADVVLAVGTELAPADLWDGPLPLEDRLVRIDIDPVQIVTNAAPIVSVVGDAQTCLDGLLSIWQRDGLPDPPDERRRWATLWRERMREEARRSSAPWDWLLDHLGEALGEPGVLAGDSTTACYRGAWPRVPAHRSRSFLYPSGYGTLGYGLPAAIGAKVGRPEARVAALIGDGGVMYTLAELAAAAQMDLPLAVVIVDNGGYGEIRDEMRERGDPPLAVDLPSPDFASLARALGCHGIQIGQPDELVAALAGAWSADRPTVLHIRGA
jgi:acetolactate synthase-1/2/3 large subunit